MSGAESEQCSRFVTQQGNPQAMSQCKARATWWTRGRFGIQGYCVWHAMAQLENDIDESGDTQDGAS